MQAVCATQWKLCLPLLQHNLRKHIKTPLRHVAQVLEDIQRFPASSVSSSHMLLCSVSGLFSVCWNCVCTSLNCLLLLWSSDDKILSVWPYLTCSQSMWARFSQTYTACRGPCGILRPRWYEVFLNCAIWPTALFCLLFSWSTLLEMRCQVHSELAVIEEEEGCLEASLTHLQKAMQLDNGSLREGLSSALHLLRLRGALYHTPSRVEDRAAMLLQQVSSLLCQPE